MPNATIPTGYEPKELVTVSIHLICMMYRKNLEKKITELPSPKKGRNLESGTAGLPDSKIPETSCFQSQMHFDDSVERIADSDLKDGELQKMLTSPLYA